MNEQRQKGWLLTQERAMEIYDFIQSSLEVTQWDVPIKSENFTKLPFADFLDKAKKRIIYKPEFSNFNPTVVADDCINILETMPQTFDQIKNRMEDVFRSILVVNEDMDGFIKDVEQDKEELKVQVSELEKQNQYLRDELEITKLELEKKQYGIKPLTDVIKIRIKEIIKLYGDFKKCIGEEKEMKKFLPIFEKEVDSTIALIQLKEQQVLESQVYKRPEEEPHKEEQGEDYDMDGEPDEFPEDDATFGEEEDDPRTELAKKHDIPIDVFLEAVEIVTEKRKNNWADKFFDMQVVRCARAIDRGERWKAPKVGK